jgi:hypothetical protein
MIVDVEPVRKKAGNLVAMPSRVHRQIIFDRFLMDMDSRAETNPEIGELIWIC